MNAHDHFRWLFDANGPDCYLPDRLAFVLIVHSGTKRRVDV